MRIRYIAHSCFLFTSDTGIRLLLDPCDESVCRNIPNVTADAIVVSHNHKDHYNLSMVHGASEVVTGAGRHNAAGVSMEGIAADHGIYEGKWLGMVNCYKFEMDGIKCLHLSDIGITLTDQEISSIGAVDVLLIPVGGAFTIGPEEAHKIAAQIKPTVIIPMHYATPGLDRMEYPLKPVNEFINGWDNVKFFRSREVEINLELLPESPEIWVISPI